MEEEVKKLLALTCTGCSGKLKFVGGLAECESCRTSFALVEGNSGFAPVSYWPLRLNDGKMQIPLKLQIAEKIKQVFGFWVSDHDFERTFFSITQDGRIHYYSDYDEVTASGYPMRVAWAEIHDVVGSFLYFFPTVSKVVRSDQMMYITVTDQTDENDVVVGESVEICVVDKKYADQANQVSGMIQSEFGVVPTMTLKHI